MTCPIMAHSVLVSTVGMLQNSVDKKDTTETLKSLSDCMENSCAWWMERTSLHGDCAIKRLAQEIMYYEKT